MDRSRLRSIALGAIAALGLVVLGAGCALDEGIDEALPDQAELDESQLDEVQQQAAEIDQSAAPQAQGLDEILASDPSAPKDLEAIWPGSPRAQAFQALAGGWARICSPDGNAGLYNGALGWHCPGRFLQNLNNGHRIYLHELYWCSSQGRYYYLVNDNHLHAGLIKASLICGGDPPV
jgi:hypothetical protein